MKQLIQYFSNGKVELIEAPVSAVSGDRVLIRSTHSLISVGTERMLVKFGRSSLLDKVRSQPDKVKQVLQKIKTDGLISTLEAVFSKLGDPIPLGYCNVGVVLEAGRNVDGVKVGDRVVSNGPHAEFVCVGKNLVCRIPDNVDDESAAFVVPGAIALQGIRLLEPQLGESVVVLGLGLIGQMAVQLLLANGCRVIGLDYDAAKVALAEQFGAKGLVLKNGESAIEPVLALTRGRGADAVLITASTDSSEPLENAAAFCRRKGRIVLTGVCKIEIPRNVFYEKELLFSVSCSYGPGRYDSLYEDKGVDYPLAYVRWTEQRNFEAMLDMMAAGRLNIKPLITHRYPFAQVLSAYDMILKSNPLGVILQYPLDVPVIRTVTRQTEVKVFSPAKPVIGYLGVGNFAKMVLLPALRKAGAQLHTVCSGDGLKAGVAAGKYGFQYAVSDKKEVFDNREINTVFISSRHSDHADLVVRALESGKNVFVEKPLALNEQELDRIEKAYVSAGKQLMVGFNRRFASYTKQLKQALLGRKEPLCICVIVNAGRIPVEHWVHDVQSGGGRIIGEGCHFIDLARFIVGSPIKTVSSITTAGHSGSDADKMIISLSFEDGSIASINYYSDGHKSYPKERVEVFCEGKTFLIDNWRKIKGFGLPLCSGSFKQDKGHDKEVAEFLRSIEQGASSLIPFNELVEVTRASFSAVESAGNL